MSRAPLPVVAARVALAAGSCAGLGWLAPLEWGTGVWLGLHEVHAVVVPTLIDSYVVLSVLTARDRRWALPIAGVSGLVGQLHAAHVLPAADPAVRGWVAALAAVIAVAVTARLKPLVAEVVAAVRVEQTALEAARADAEVAARAAVQAELDAAHRRAMEAERAAHEQRLAEAAHAADMAARETTQAAPRAARTSPTRRPRTGAPKRPARAPHEGSDLQRRAAVRGLFEAAEHAHEPWDNARLARELYGVTDPDQRQVRAASARASEWRRALTRDAGTGDGTEAAR